MKILLTNVGRRTYFVDYLEKLIDKNYKIEIYVSDRSRNVASYFSNISKFIILPKVIDNHKKYIDVLYKKCLQHKINLIIPLSDLDLMPLSLNKLKFKKINCDIIISNPNIIKICEDKKDLNKFLKKNNFKSPNIFLDKNKILFPIICKPNKGSGSKDNIIYRKKDDFPKEIKKEYIYQKFIYGQEYGLDILNDFKGRFVSYCLKKKIEMRSGETDKAYTKNNKKILNISKKISKNLKHIGNLDCDLIIDKNDNIYFIDFNCRFGGGYPFTHAAGLNYLEFLINEKLKKKNINLPLKYKEKFIAKGIQIYYEN